MKTIDIYILIGYYIKKQKGLIIAMKVKEYVMNTDHIRDVKRKKNVKTEAIAKALKVKELQVYRFISGKRNINILKAKVLADILEISIDELVKEKE
jgi:ribosome-binding protein aMBF1 (putative translation factor)